LQAIRVLAAATGRTSTTCFSFKPEEPSTRCGGQGVTVFFGMAKQVRAPQIGPARPGRVTPDERLISGARTPSRSGARNDRNPPRAG
jgi:hypothetical protein